MKKVLWLVFVVGVLFVGYMVRGVSAQADSTIDLANQLYERGDYNEAVQLYEQATITSADLFYNLGNAYYQQGELGKAIANYRRALALAPRDADALANLALARAAREDQIPPVYDWTTTFANWHARWTTNEVAVAALASWLIVGSVLFVWMTVPRWRRVAQWTLVPLMGCLLVTGFALGQRVTAPQQAVIVAESADVHTAPTANSVIQFTLHDGAEVDLLEQRNGWVKIDLLGDESQGWLPMESVDVIDL